jgi:hypothetical protein
MPDAVLFTIIVNRNNIVISAHFYRLHEKLLHR